jgi:PAS domain S-box-containing protein
MAKNGRIHWEQRFKDTADLLPGVICEMDLDFRVTYANQAAFDSLKYNEKNIEDGVYLTDLMHPEDLEKAKQNIVKLLKGVNIGPQEYRIRHNDGKVLEYQINSAPMVQDGRVVGIRTCIFDISERKEAARQLKQSEERFRRIFSESPIGISLFTLDGRLIEANPSFCRMFSLDEAAPSTGFKGLFDLISIDDAATTKLKSGQAVQYGGAFAFESDPNAADRERHLEWHLIPIMSVDARRPLYLVQVQDVTERHRAEAARLKSAEEAAKNANRLVENLRQEVRRTFTFADMVSRSPSMRRIFDILPQVAATPTTVLVTGESGTGKELIARALHELGPRKKKSFVAVNCSALPDNLLESELFGYKAGAFTDAKKDKPGKFALAEGGVLFLDEIGDVSPAMQVKLLRVLQEKVYEPLGAVKSESADVRVVTATNKDLLKLVKDGSFREDLYYRLNVLNIKLPPLRERRADIPLLCDHFINRFNKRYDRVVTGISKTAMDQLLVHDFNGNIRELENIIEHAFVFCIEGEISLSHLPETFNESDAEATAKQIGAFNSFDELEATYIRTILEQTGGSKQKAAEKLGIHKSTLFRKLKRLGIE